MTWSPYQLMYLVRGPRCNFLAVISSLSFPTTLVITYNQPVTHCLQNYLPTKSLVGQSIPRYLYHQSKRLLQCLAPNKQQKNLLVVKHHAKTLRAKPPATLSQNERLGMSAIPAASGLVVCISQSHS